MLDSLASLESTKFWIFDSFVVKNLLFRVLLEEYKQVYGRFLMALVTRAVFVAYFPQAAVGDRKDLTNCPCCNLKVKKVNLRTHVVERCPLRHKQKDLILKMLETIPA